jgi:FAD:protein FMN transferase
MEELIVKKELFGKDVEIILFGMDKFLGEEIIRQVYKEGIRLSKIFNFYDKTSELSRLNKERKLKVSKELLEVMKKAIEFSKLTNGNYDVSLGKQFLERKMGGQIKEVSCSYKDIKIEGSMIMLGHPDLVIDLGSISKGYIADKMVDFLIAEGVEAAMIDARGDIRIFGDKEVVIGVQNPRDKEKSILKMRIKNLAIATSGDYNQYDKEFKKSHILNQKDLISISVVADNLTEADAYATALFVLGQEEREIILINNKNIRVCAIDFNLKIRYHNGFEKLVIV